jgi:hypothetical protein
MRLMGVTVFVMDMIHAMKAQLGTQSVGDGSMPRYLVERTFPNQFAIPIDQGGAQACQVIIDNDTLEHVTWLHSYVTLDKLRSIWVCDAPSPEAVRRAAQRNNLPIDRITEVRVFDPYFFL